MGWEEEREFLKFFNNKSSFKSNLVFLEWSLVATRFYIHGIGKLFKEYVVY